ncbi:MAG TPA: heparinase II/III family protein [Stellaceae bacterium]|nr:heparinase II/III family protein [Stellaceae bacterium]
MRTGPTRTARPPASRGAPGAGGTEGPDLFTRLRRDGLRLLAASPLYRHTLIGPVPGNLRLKLDGRWPGEARRGAAILAGDIEFSGEMVRNPMPVWFPPGVGTAWLAAWHGFGWLDDLIATGAAARDPARALVQSWLAENAAWHPVAWRSDVMATRVFAWIVHFEEIAGREADRALRRAMLASIAAQVRHLARTATWERSGAARLRALKGLLGGLAALGGSHQRIARALRVLEGELPVQILPDGGHRTRSPSVQLAALRDLIDVRAVLRAAKIEVPGALQQAIERMAPMLRFFRHGDRRLALFNNSVEEDAVLVDLVLTRSETRGHAPLQAPHSGFQRLQAGQSLVIVDTGKPPSPGFDEEAHAGILSFELSQGRERVIVNCGGYRGTKAAWHRVARSSAAHSVLVVGDTNAVEIRADGSLGPAPASVRCERAEEGGHQWIAASHDGYRGSLGVTYSRELYLAADGDDLRGEDKLTGRSGAVFAVRFHLHPAVEASLIDSGSGGVLLRLPSGAHWRLRAAGAEMTLAESIYLGAGELRKTQQIVLSGTTAGGGATVRWALRREARSPEPRPTPEPPPETTPTEGGQADGA